MALEPIPGADCVQVPSAGALSGTALPVADLSSAADSAGQVDTLDELRALQEAVRDYRGSSRAPATQRYYDADWLNYEFWCQRMGLSPLPIHPEQVALYVADLAQQVRDDGTPRYKASSIRRYVSSIAHKQYLEGGGRGLGSHEAIAETVAGVTRIRQETTVQKRPLSLEEIRRVIVEMGLLNNGAGPQRDQWPYPVAIARDRLAILLGLDTAMRRSEVVGLNVGDIDRVSKGLRVLLRKSKTDQEGRGQIKAVPYGDDPALCTPCHWVRWLRLLATSSRAGAIRIARQDIEPGTWTHICRARLPEVAPDLPLLRPVNKAGVISDRRLSDTSLNRAFLRRLEEANFDPAPYGYHSLRASFVTISRENGASTRDVSRQTTQSADIVARYDRTNDPFRDNAVNYLRRREDG